MRKPRAKPFTDPWELTEPWEQYAHESAEFRERMTEKTEERTIVETRYKIPAYGFLERLEIQPRQLLPNMDAGQLYSCEIRLYDPQGNPVDFYVEAVYRNVKDLRE